METQKMTQAYRLNQWAKTIHECRNSGLTIRKWCAEHNIREGAYYYWLKKVRTVACDSLPAVGSNSNQIVEVKIPEKPETNVGDTSSAIILHFGSATMELHNGASETLIENILRALQHVR